MKNKGLIILLCIAIFILSACQNENKISYSPDRRIRDDLIGQDLGFEKEQIIKDINCLEVYKADDKNNSIFGRFECKVQPHNNRYILDFTAYYDFKDNELVLKNIDFDNIYIVVKGSDE